jgi:hypothetical protein
VTDWRQIRARIRRAKSGQDATTRLEQLYDKTRDGMVAFELAQLEEMAGRVERATDWYKRAWQRFRRSEWKQKAEEALTRFGVPLPTDTSEAPREPREHATPAEPSAEPEQETISEAAPQAETETETETEAETETETDAHDAAPVETAGAQLGPTGEKRRRRRRGGRGRRRGRGAGRPEGAETQSETTPAPESPRPPTPSRPPAPSPAPRAKEVERRPAREQHVAQLPPIHIYRRGEPALASEIKALEAKLRQLLAAHPSPIEQISELPASPGVYLVSDLDLTTMYYVESCGNIRAAMDQLVSGRHTRQGSVRARLGRYLGISDAQAGRYLKQHGLVRWIEFEESEAVALGHFAAAVLRPELMEEST